MTPVREAAAPRAGAGVELPERRLRRAVVAVDDRPQAHRAPVPGVDHAVLLPRRRVRRGDPARAADARRATSSTPTPTTSCSRMHGVIMIFFFLIPSIPAVLGNFLIPMMIGANDLAFPRLNLLSWYIFMIGGADHALRGGPRRRRHGLDVLHALQHDLLEHARRGHGARRVHHRLLVDPDRAELHRHDPQDARSRA